ncbi:DUF6478 family protein [Paracoccus sp. SCSIO 75233]|uniref:DUF6478 family protein n=1 Tax=Paracoccus sp. SCSIO 75233 TaxID=3017782 RepID=UPI0022F09B6C|nr:DUF6478 family protein [Paracoccus sp. SCSIO 75233]WBU54045.1 DUF6478 family protein [Paracoccus sp. SCSIO 75233]
MAFRPSSWSKRTLRQRARSHWADLRKGANRLSKGQIRDLQQEATGLRQELTRFLHASDSRVSASRLELEALPLPGGTDWRWRPEMLSVPISLAGLAGPQSGAKLNDSATLWHDCEHCGLILRQVQNLSTIDLANFGLTLETIGFGGSFMSLAIGLPDAALQGLTSNHIIRLESVILVESEADVYVRLNIGNGPNTETLLRHIGDPKAGELMTSVIEFDLATTEMNEKRLDNIWLDFIVEQPTANKISLREMIFSRHPRANI